MGESCQGNNSGMKYDTETGECIVGECAAGSYQVSCGQNAEDKIESSVAGVGGWGGTCTCPSGETYQVGDNEDSCGSLACVNGVSGKCGSDNPGGANVRVTCMSEAEAAKQAACTISEAAKACHVCEAGKFQPMNEQRCGHCPVGTYADETGTAILRMMTAAHSEKGRRVEVTKVSLIMVKRGLCSTAITAVTQFKSNTKVAMTIS